MKTALLIGLSLVALSAYALEKQDFVGHYKLVEALNGVCPERVEGTLQELLNETSSPTLSFYCKQDSADCHRVIYQLTDINSGNQIRYQQNPMTGFYDSVHFSRQTLAGNKLSAFNQTSRLNGALLWKTSFKAVLDGKTLTYEFEEQNNLVNTVSADHCRYTKVK